MPDFVFKVIVLGILGLLMGMHLGDVMASERIDWVQRSLDKTIIVEHNRTYTVPAPQGSGTTVVTKGRTVPQITRDARIMNGGIVKYDFQLVPRNVRNNHSSRGADPIVRPNLP